MGPTLNLKPGTRWTMLTLYGHIDLTDLESFEVDKQGETAGTDRCHESHSLKMEMAHAICIFNWCNDLKEKLEIIRSLCQTEKEK